MTFDHVFRFQIADPITKNIGAEFKSSSFLSEPIVTTCKQHNQVAATTHRCPEALKFVENDAFEVSEVFLPYLQTLRVFSYSYMVLLYCVVKRYLIKSYMPKDDFPIHAFYKVGPRKVIALRVFFSKIDNTNLFLFASSEIIEFLLWKIAFRVLQSVFSGSEIVSE